jgi:hypothetical protein
VYNNKKKEMKKILLNVTAVILITCSLSSCATVFGGEVSDCQRTKPVAGQPSRAIRGGALIADILLFWPGVIVDFATGAIYKPCNNK